MSKLWRMSLGKRGCRVVLFERKPGGPLYREVYVGGRRVAAQRSLKHADQVRAEADAYALLAELKTCPNALGGGPLTLQRLFDKYVESGVHRAKKPTTQRDDVSRLRRVIGFMGYGRDPLTLSDEDVEQYKKARMQGELGKAVRPRAVEGRPGVAAHHAELGITSA